MNSAFVTALTRALPSLGRSCQLRAPAVSLTRPFSSTPTTLENPKDSAREIERQILNTASEPQQAPRRNSSLSAINHILSDRMKNEKLSADFIKMADSLEAEMTKQRHADRSPPHQLHIYTHRHNLHLTLTRPNGNPLLSMSCGQLGFRKAKRGGYDAGYQLSAHVFGQIQEKGLLPDIKRLALSFRGWSLAREAFIKVLLGNEGRNIRGLVCSVTDATRIKFGGPRSRKVRRLG
ncbi:translational machinery component [Aspergillus heteromorphus CBS 117.55]|uniref:Translational machinery component n=1 Tax=Aspergillus heteromorphus CBS 117.55 TaxID=1448321 RepID=A0A317W5E9_9EURO|nr:translational machinery component [Aspergillus heteromorphus CBS 117.55]PWY81886.1 translational machinery component [Aspergillus heteromorphus CBS 117.55]